MDRITHLSKANGLLPILVPYMPGKTDEGSPSAVNSNPHLDEIVVEMVHTVHDSVDKHASSGSIHLISKFGREPTALLVSERIEVIFETELIRKTYTITGLTMARRPSIILPVATYSAFCIGEKVVLLSTILQEKYR